MNTQLLALNGHGFSLWYILIIIVIIAVLIWIFSSMRR